MQFFPEYQPRLTSWSKFGSLSKHQDLDGLLTKNCRYVNITPDQQITEVFIGQYQSTGYHIGARVTTHSVYEKLKNLLISTLIIDSPTIHHTNIIKLNTMYLNDICYFFNAIQQIEASVREFERDLAQELGIRNLSPITTAQTTSPIDFELSRQITKLSLHEPEASTDHSDQGLEDLLEDPDLMQPFIMD